MEIIATLAYQLSDKATKEQMLESGFESKFIEHGLALYYTDSGGVPWTATYIQAKDDPITDLTEDMAAEQKARLTYDNILRLADDPDVKDPIRFLRAREIVHYQRFGEGLRIIQDNLDKKNFYAINPEFDLR